LLVSQYRSVPSFAAGTPGILVRWRSATALAAFGIVFVATLIIALGQGIKPFYYDSGQYWLLGESFVQNGHFSLLNFEGPTRGYVLPLVDHGLQGISTALQWRPSSLVKLFNVIVFTFLGAVLAPRFAAIAWPKLHWGIARRVALSVLLLVFWSGYLNFPLSDFPALAMALVAFAAVTRPESPGWMAVVGIAAGLTIDIRAAYSTLLPILIVLVVWGWWERRGGPHASTMRRALCVLLLAIGFAAVSLPQSLAEHRHFGTWSFVPGSKLNLAEEYLTRGLSYQRYDTYVGPEKAATMNFYDESGLRLLRDQPSGEVENYSQYMSLVVNHPVTIAGVLARHVINGLDARYSTPYVEHVDTGPRVAQRVVGFLLIFLALARVLWPAARRSLGSARWRYPAALIVCCLTSLLTAVEVRVLLPMYLLSYLLVLAPGWPNPLGPAGSGPRRWRTPVILAISGLLFTVVVWHVTSSASDHLHFG
jgi:hypothetical protein